MRRSSTILWSTSAMAFALCATPAFAQDETQPAVPPDPTVQAQTNPADPDQGSPQTDDAVQTANGQDQATIDDQTIVVTGLRRSLQSAQNIKRNSDQIVDAIVAEDIGKLPDITVSDTAARIPGVQVERSGGEANRVLLRGLDERFYATTYNGREIFTAETRSVALQDFPAGAIAAVEAFKTSTANLVEPGLAGLVNVRSRRPFDFKGLEVAGSVWGVYTENAKDLEPNGALLISNRWNAGDGEIGALINFSYTRMHFEDWVRRHGFFIADLGNPSVGRSPDWPEIHYNEAERWRPSINGALQYRNGDLQLYAEGLWQGYREHQHDRDWEQPLWSCGRLGVDPGAASYSDIVYRNGSDAVVSGTVTQPGCVGQTRGFQGATPRRTNTYQFAVGGSYDAGPLQITADLARTTSKFKLRTESVDYQLNTNNFSVDWFTGEDSDDDGPTFQVVGLDPTDISLYNFRGFFEDYLDAKGNDWQARLDFEYETGLDALPKVQWGVRHVNRKASRTAGSYYWDLFNFGGPITGVPLDYVLFDEGFRGDDMKPFPLTWYAPTWDSIHDNLDELREYSMAKCLTVRPASACGSLEGPATDPTRTFRIKEQSLAGYVQANFLFDLGGTSIDGLVGVRVVRTKDTSSGTQFSIPDPVPISVSNTYTDVLPNANLNIHFSPEWTLRLAATETRTRPTFEQLNPSLHLDQFDANCNPTQVNCIRTGSAGNPNLKPLKSTNYDASLEYYFSRNGFASLALFHRNMRGFIANIATQYPDPDPESGFPLIITQPTNTNRGKVQGMEAQVSTFFDYDWAPGFLRSFGVQANATYLDAKADFNIFQADNPNHSVRRLRIPGVSKWTYNLVGMYENGGFTARLAYNWRTKYPEGDLSERDGFFTLQGLAHPSDRLDWSSSYAFNDKLTVFLDWTNILKNPFKSDIVRVQYAPAGEIFRTEQFPMVVRFEERVLSGGIRFRFGGGERPAAAAAPAQLPPPPPPPVETAPQPVPPPPPPPPPAPERG